jgi:transposase
MFRKKDAEQQQSIWIATSELATTPASTFYQKVDRALENFSFGEKIRTICTPFYQNDASKGGRPGIDPEVYFKMLLIGFFENLSSERGIASRCADSLSIREFLHYSLSEQTPDHSSLSVIRTRLSPDVYRAAFGLMLDALKQTKLLNGTRIAIDASTLEANASLRSLEHRLSGDAYWEYVKKLAEAAGVDANDAAAVRRFDKNREDRKTSNKEWVNPHDPDAKVGRTKRGATRMIYKPEHIVDLDTGAIVDVDIRPGDEHDTENLSERIVAAEERLNQAVGNDPGTKTFEIVTSDKGYYKVKEVTAIQGRGLKTVISDPIDNRKLEKLSVEEQNAVRAAKESVSAEYGKELLKRRGELLERSFEHALDCGGARQTTLRGTENILKRYLIQAMGVNLSLLLRTLIGIGTVKQALAASEKALQACCSTIILMLERLIDNLTHHNQHGGLQRMFSADIRRLVPQCSQITSLVCITR